MLNFIKIRPVPAELFHADGKTDGRDAANIHYVYRELMQAAQNLFYSYAQDRQYICRSPQALMVER